MSGRDPRYVLVARPLSLGIAGRAPDSSRGTGTRAGAQFFPPVPPPGVHRSSDQAAVTASIGGSA